MSSRTSSWLAIVGLAVSTLPAQDMRLAGPVSGALFDQQAKAIRPIVGVPGAAYLGGALAEGIELASISPDGKLALASAGGKLYLVPLAEPGAGWRVLEQSPASLSRIVWNDEATAVAAAGETLLLWRHVSGDPEPVWLTGVGDLAVTAIAVGADGGSVAIGSKGGVYVVDGNGRRLVAAMEEPSALAVHGADLYVADRGLSQVFAIRNYTTSPEPALVAGPAQGVEDPVALRISGDRSLMVAGATSRSLLLLDISTGAVTARLELDFEPDRLERISGSRLLLLNSRKTGTEPIQVVTGGEHPAVYFIPAGSVEE